ncbi:ABC transporter permease [Lacisediminimonas sp.]|uniref:ABC transporter permease n=1 Tax=Lacisediminimonas sp. TaxID=3060582 RepID=UPI0027228B12|nr:ABC transporter permease [Lacisediminimonas sp.]MDO8298732.1 ABC transporter permease [Lacisediminimonas sp.]
MTNNKGLSDVPKIWISISAVVMLLVIWTLVTNMGMVSPTYLPSPQSLFNVAGDLIVNGYQRSSIQAHIGISLFRALTGFLLGVLLGIPTGLISGYNRVVDASVSPIMAFVRPIPPIAFIPMAVLYFGLGEVGKVVLIFFTAFNYAHVNAHAGASHVPIAYIRAAKSLGLSSWQQFYKIVMPAALPQIFTGLKVAMALSWAVVVAAELVGAQKGLGFMISDAAQLFQIPVVFIGIGLIGLIGLILNWSLSAMETAVVHWKGR